MKFHVSINQAAPVEVEAKDANAAVDAARALCPKMGEHLVEVRDAAGVEVSTFGHCLEPEPETQPDATKGVTP